MRHIKMGWSAASKSRRYTARAAARLHPWINAASYITAKIAAIFLPCIKSGKRSSVAAGEKVERISKERPVIKAIIQLEDKLETLAFRPPTQV